MSWPNQQCVAGSGAFFSRAFEGGPRLAVREELDIERNIKKIKPSLSYYARSKYSGLWCVSGGRNFKYLDQIKPEETLPVLGPDKPEETFGSRIDKPEETSGSPSNKPDGTSGFYGPKKTGSFTSKEPEVFVKPLYTVDLIH